MIAALDYQGIGESLILLGSANAAVFERYVEEVLVAHLRVGQIIVMDNLSCY